MREKELTEEIEFHRAMRERKYREQHGMSEQEAADKAKRDFGGFEKWKEVCRDVGRWRFLDELRRDLVLAVRMLRKSPVFTLVALVTLTLAIGANTAIFTLMNTIMLKILPVPNAQRLVILRTQPMEFGYVFSYPVFKELARRSEALTQVFAFTGRSLQTHTSDGLKYMSGELVSGQYFSALGVRPQLGRWIEPSDDTPGTPQGAVAVVSNAFWHSRLSGDSKALGRQITVNNTVCTVIGVMPEGFRGMSQDARPDVFIPLELEPSIDAPFNSIKAGYQNWWIQVGAKRNDGVSMERLNAYLKTNSHEVFEATAPNASFTLNGHKSKELFVVAEPGATGYSYLRIRFREPLMVLMGLVAMVLLIACLNLASLLMARASSRSREITTRFALGASRMRLLRQLLTESLLLSLFGTVLGLALSPVIAHSVATIIAPQNGPTDIPLDVSPDFTVLGFTALVAILATVLTGTLPALRSTRTGLHKTVRGSEKRQLWPRIVLSLEVALALVLVSGASLLGYSLVQLRQTPMGFESSGLLYLPLDTHKQSIEGKALLVKYREIMEQVLRLRDVNAVSISQVIPLTMNWMTADAKAPGGTDHELWQNHVGPDYFKTMRTPLISGRDFRWTDTDATGPKVILNQAAARLLFPKGNAVGEHLAGNKQPVEIVGVVADAKYTTLRDAPPPTAYWPATQDLNEVSSFVVLVRTNGPPAPLIAAAGKIVQRVLPEIPYPGAVSMEQTVAESIATERIMATLALFFGGVALLITGIGLYGTLAYATERRTGEIGIRLALGAMPRNVISMVCAENGAIAVLGCIIGVVCSVAASKTIASFLYGVSPKDPIAFGVAAGLLLAVAAAASLVPAVKASKIDPIAAIRYE